MNELWYGSHNVLSCMYDAAFGIAIGLESCLLLDIQMNTAWEGSYAINSYDNNSDKVWILQSL